MKPRERFRSLRIIVVTGRYPPSPARGRPIRGAIGNYVGCASFFFRALDGSEGPFGLHERTPVWPWFPARITAKAAPDARPFVKPLFSQSPPRLRRISLEEQRLGDEGGNSGLLVRLGDQERRLRPLACEKALRMGGNEDDRDFE